MKKLSPNDMQTPLRVIVDGLVVRTNLIGVNDATAGDDALGSVIFGPPERDAEIDYGELPKTFPARCRFGLDRSQPKAWVLSTPANPTEALLCIRAITPLLALSRRLNPLHAAVIRMGSSPAVALIGASGVGKTTLKSWLCRAGCCELTDDLSALDSTRVLHSPDATACTTFPAELDTLLFLERSNECSEPRLDPLSQRETATALLRHGYGDLVPHRLRSTYASLQLDLATRVRGHRFVMPDDLDRLPSAAQLIRNTFF